MIRNLVIYISILILLLTACSHQDTLADYEAYHIKVARKKVVGNDGEFSILLPKNWEVEQDDALDGEDEAFLFALQAMKPDTAMVVMNIIKMKLLKGEMDKEFDRLLNEVKGSYQNIQIVERSAFKIGEENVQSALLKFEQDGNITHEEIDLFMPVSDSTYYFLGLVSEKNENNKHNLALMLACAKTLEVREE